jgi:hypothetical protein
MKRWTTRQALSGNLTSPAGFNDEFRNQQSSITTLDRTQLPTASVDESNLKDYAIHRIWYDKDFPTGGEQTVDKDTSVSVNMWESSTAQVHAGGWTSIGTVPLTGFSGGSLFLEWTFNAYVQNIFAKGANDGRPGSPAYMRARILVNGVVIVERRGTSYHEHMRVTGSQQFPPGDLSVDFQFRLTELSQDGAVNVSGLLNTNLMQAHLWNSRYLAFGRWR